jgi:hypothetical protein
MGPYSIIAFSEKELPLRNRGLEVCSIRNARDRSLALQADHGGKHSWWMHLKRLDGQITPAVCAVNVWDM